MQSSFVLRREEGLGGWVGFRLLLLMLLLLWRLLGVFVCLLASALGGVP